LSRLLFADSFDHYDISQMTRKGWVIPFFSGMRAGRYGNGVDTFNGSYYEHLLAIDGSTFAEVAAGVGYKTSSFSADPITFLGPDNRFNFSVYHIGDGRLNVQFCGTAQTLYLPQYVVRQNEWYHFQLYANVYQVVTLGLVTTASIRVKLLINEDQILPGGIFTEITMSVDVTNIPGPYEFERIRLQGALGAQTSVFDDLWITDGELLGDLKVDVFYPMAPGSSTQWTPFPGPANWDMVDETPADDDLSIVAAGPSGTFTDLYEMQNTAPTFSGDIQGSQALWLLTKTSGGDAVVKGLYDESGSQIETTFQLSAANGQYLYSWDPQRKSLFTSNDWTKAEIDGLQLGARRYS
jgi:hypothetical protein